jgi:hypothetical protein
MFFDLVDMLPAHKLLHVEGVKGRFHGWKSGAAIGAVSHLQKVTAFPNA